MRIGIDGSEANIGQKVGVHQYAFQILWSFYKLNSELDDSSRDFFTIYLKNQPSRDLPKECDWWKYKVIKASKFWILTKLTPELIFNKKVDVFFSPTHYLPLTRMSMVFTVHDLGYLEFPEQFRKKDYYQLKYWTHLSFKFAKRIIAVSEATKSDIVSHYQIDPNRIKVVYHGFEKDRFHIESKTPNEKQVLDKYHINKPYLLYLGTLKPSKNISGLVEAYSKVTEDKKEEYDLVIVGKKGWLYQDIYKQVKKLALANKVKFTGYIDEAEKEVFYKNAKLLVQPSYWEGFGMQILDSMAMGTPVVISNVASLPEVGGDAAIYVEPDNVSSVSAGIQRVLDMNKVQYNRLIRKGLKQAEKFSWDKAGKETIQLIKSAI